MQRVSLRGPEVAHAATDLHCEPGMTKHAEQDDFRSPQPATARTEARIKELRPLLERAEYDDAALGALFASLTELDVRAVGRALGERISALSHQHRYAAATGLCERLAARSSGLPTRRAFVGAVVVGLRPAALTHDAASHASDAEFPDVLALHDSLLDEMVAPAVMGAASVEERDRRRRVLARLEVRGAAAAQGAASALATSPPEPAALELCGLLERAGAQRGVPGLEVALVHPAPHVRQEALKALLRIASSDVARQRALAALDGADPVARRVALDHVAAARLAEAVPRLRRRAESGDFDDLEYADKKRILVALAGLTGEGAHSLLDRILHQRNLLRSRAVEESRIAAACALALLRDAGNKDDIEKLHDRTTGPLRQELDQALLLYDRQTAPGEITQAEATARLKSQPPQSRSPAPAEPRPMAEPRPVGGFQPAPYARTAGGGAIDLDSEPPLLPTSHVSVPHAQGSSHPSQTRVRSRPAQPAPERPAIAGPPPPPAADDGSAAVVDPSSSYQEDE